MKLRIDGAVVSKKNSRNLFVKNVRMMNLPNQKYKDWEKNALLQIKSQFKGTADGAVIVTIEIYNKDKRKRDLDNQASSVLDMLVKSGLLEDDSCYHVEELHVIFGGVDKTAPRAVINIEEIDVIID